MPMYDFKCTSSPCNHVFEKIVKFEERENVLCEKCGSATKPLIVPHRYIPFKEGWYEHIAKDPIYIKSMKQLKSECKKHGVSSIYAMDR